MRRPKPHACGHRFMKEPYGCVRIDVIREENGWSRDEPGRADAFGKNDDVALVARMSKNVQEKQGK